MRGWSKPLCLAIVVLIGCTDWIAPISVGAPCSVGSDCGDGVCYKGHCLPRPQCNGDGIIQSGEVCDDGNFINDDGCTNDCLPARCGDGVVRKDLDPTHPDYEDCESGLAYGSRVCRSDCVFAPEPRRLVVSSDHTCILAPDDPDGRGPLRTQPMGFCFAGSKSPRVTDGSGNVLEWATSRSVLRLQFEFRATGFDSICSEDERGAFDSQVGLVRSELGTLHYGRLSDSINPGNPQWLAETFLSMGVSTRQGQRTNHRFCVLKRSGYLMCRENYGPEFCLGHLDAEANFQRERNFESHQFVGFATAETSVCGVNKSGTVWCFGDNRYWHAVPSFEDEDESDMGTCEVETHQPSESCPICVQAEEPYSDYCVNCLTDSDCAGADRCWQISASTRGFGDRSRCLSEADYQVYVECGGRQRGVALDDMPPIASLVAGRQHYVALTADGRVIEWGAMLGLDEDRPDAIPFRYIDVPERAVQVGVSAISNCVLTETGDVWCWSHDPPQAAQPLLGVPPLREIASGNYNGFHLCGLADDKTVYCWGRYPNAELDLMEGYIPPDWPFSVVFVP